MAGKFGGRAHVAVGFSRHDLFTVAGNRRSRAGNRCWRRSVINLAADPRQCWRGRVSAEADSTCTIEFKGPMTAILDESESQSKLVQSARVSLWRLDALRQVDDGDPEFTDHP